MCGIAAFFRIDPEDRLHILKGLEIRGRDGFGFYAYRAGEHPVVDKSLQTPTDYINGHLREQVELYDYPIMLANTRAVPTTEFQTGAGLDISNQQPFTTSNYALVFNGLVTNDQELIKKYDLHPEAKVDTAMLLPLFERVGILEGLKMLDGAFAIIVFDKVARKLYFARNFMPLVYKADKTEAIAVSLREMVSPYTLRDSLQEVPPYSCVVYDMESGTSATHSLWRNTRNKKALIIFSSGIDSVVTAWLYKHLGYDLTLLHFTYGQAAQPVERWAAEQLAKELNAPLIVHDASGIFKEFSENSRLLKQREATSSEQMEDAEGTLSYVPNRNGIFAMIAAAWAEKLGCDTVAYGGQQMSASYPDNSIDFTMAIDKAFKYSLNWQKNIKFAAPMIHLIKHEIVKLGLALNVPYDIVCSCYYPKLENGTITVCGRCGCCQFRFSSFKMLGVKDTQKYATLPSPDWFDGLKDKLEWSMQDRETFIYLYCHRYV